MSLNTRHMNIEDDPKQQLNYLICLIKYLITCSRNWKTNTQKESKLCVLFRGIQYSASLSQLMF